MIGDCQNNSDGLTVDKMKKLGEEKFWMRTLITQHHSRSKHKQENSKHNLNGKTTAWKS